MALDIKVKSDQRALLILFTILLLRSPLAFASDKAVASSSLELPPPVGYRIGDNLSVKLTLMMNEGWILDRDSLPENGRINRWLEYHGTRIQMQWVEGMLRYELMFNYLLVGNPEKLTVLVVPSLIFNLSSAKDNWPFVIEPWSYTLSPILPTEARLPGQKPLLQAVEPPPLINTAQRKIRLFFFAVSIAICILYIVFTVFGIHWKNVGNRPFRQAFKSLRKLNRNLNPEQYYRQSLKIFHRAMAQTYGANVMSADLDHFFRQFPVFRPQRQAIEKIYAASNKEFFDKSQEPRISLDVRRDLLPLCRECSRLETQA